MDVYTSFLIIFGIYSGLYFLDRFYKTCSHYPYIQFLKGTGLEVKFLHIKWQTTALNRTFLRWGSGHSSFLNLWFQWGTYTSLVLLPIAIIILFVALFQTFFKQTVNTSVIMEPVIPGINLPASELGYYSLTLIISSIVHETGHAIAAVREDVHLSNVGVNLFFILPVAYVSLNTEDIQKLNQKKALKIFCAGVWHNIVLGLASYVTFLILPVIFSSLYVLNSGVIVTDIAKNSPLKGNNGLYIGDKIVQINNCETNNLDSWYECIQKLRLNKPGFCINADIVNRLDETSHVKHISNGEVNCCPSGKVGSACFEYIEHNNGIVEIPQHSCLPIRPIIEKSTGFCSFEIRCSDDHCIKPLLNNSTYIMKIARLHKDVIYMGHPYDLIQTVQVSQYIPKYQFVSTNLAYIVERLFKYITIFSLGLAILNIIPCTAMDGQHITNTLISILLGPKIKDSKILATISLSVSLCGSFLLFCLILHSIWTHLPF